MPSQPKIDPAKLRSQISRRIDNSFPVFAPLVWHAGHARQEIGMPSETDFDVRVSIISWESHIIAKYILGSLKLQVSCLAINADYNKKSHVCHNVCHGIDWQNWRQKPGFINKKFKKTTLFMHKIEYITCNQRLILLFQTDIDISGSRFKFDRGKAS